MLNCAGKVLMVNEQLLFKRFRMKGRTLLLLLCANCYIHFSNSKTPNKPVSEKPYECRCCGCCKIGTCENKCLETCEENNNCGCLGNCKDGYFGGRCFNKCPVNCITCTDHPHVNTNSSYQNYGYCTKCIDGHYKTETYFQCQIQCQTPCATCLSKYECISCTPGYYIESGQPGQCMQCPTGCSACLSDEKCASCRDGYYLEPYTAETRVYGTCKQCQADCQTCVSVESCTSCMNGYYGNVCEQQCSTGCISESCYQNSGICEKGCNSDFTGLKCDSCIAGNHGQRCDLSCPVDCLDNICERDTGNCVECPEHFEGTKCENCTVSYHGVKCNENCSKHCHQERCERFTGYCSYGCIGNFAKPFCRDCIDGKYGTWCMEACPINCLDKKCDRQTGVCFHCKPHFNGSICNFCEQGYYDKNCSSICPHTCKYQNCEMNNGRCLSCSYPYYYGEQCELNCSANCQNQTCERTSGICDNGCLEGFSGDKCCLNNSFCEECLSDTSCFKCISSKYGETCQENCPGNCETEKCDKESGECFDCTEGFQGPKCLVSTVTDALKDTSSTGAIVGSIVGVVVLFSSFALVIVLYRKRRVMFRKAKYSGTRNNVNFRSRSVIYENANNLVSGMETSTEHVKSSFEVHDSSQNSTNTSANIHLHVDGGEDDLRNTYYNESEVENRSILPVESLAEYVGRKGSNFFNEEFISLPDGLIKPCTEAKKPENLGKNRYNAIYPYDETRVKLSGPETDFINACYINGYQRGKEFIASLGPIWKATEGFKTFWRMVWQEKTDKIVMLTNLVERGTMKCEQYWPDVGSPQVYGDVTVTCHSEDVYAEYTLRTFTVEKGKTRRQLNHIHYTAWPDKGVPDDVMSLIEFRQRVKATKSRSKSRTIVHCSAGVGRTGTFIALDILTKQGQAEGHVDIFGCVHNLRQQRTKMVQTPEQYEYLHHALLYCLSAGCEAVPAEDFIRHVTSSTAEQMDARFETFLISREKVSDNEQKAIRRKSEQK